MHLTRVLISAGVLAVTGVVLAQGTDGGTGPSTSTGVGLCIDTTGTDKQPPFTRDAGIPSAIIVTDDAPPKLRLNTNLNVLDPERIILPFEQDIEGLIVDDQAGNGASHTLGWFYYDDLIRLGYVDIKDPNDPNDDVLVDRNGNGVPDFHEDLYNISAGPSARAYVGRDGPRCPGRAVFNHVIQDGGTRQFREPDLLTGPCNSSGSYMANHGPTRWNAGTGYPPQPTTGGIVGQIVNDFAGSPYNFLDSNDNLNPSAIPDKVDGWFSDRGAFPHIPNLLEPADPANDNKGIGHLVFLATDDDDNKCPQSGTAECLAPRIAWDKNDDPGDGIPDYKASAFDTNGRLKPGRSAAEPITEEDRRVKMGRIQGNRELVFFLVVYVEQIYGAATDSCFATQYFPDGGAQCNLWMHGDINVFFSKTLLNMDLHQSLNTTTVTTKTLGSGWLSSTAYNRLKQDGGAYGGITFPAGQTQNVMSYNRRAAHTLVGAPRNNPLVWILGWEDQNAGGNRTYNDIVILINKQNNGSYRSDVVSDISLDEAQDYTITEVTFEVDDQAYFVGDGGTANACRRQVSFADGGVGLSQPKITYQVALDCKECTANCDTSSPTFVMKNNPSWVDVPMPDPDGGTAARHVTSVVNDFLERGFTGSQLCWRAVLESPGEACQPTINDVNVSYKAQKAGEYGRASITPLANAVVYGVYETPGRTWFSATGVNPSARVFDDGGVDLADRGHVHLKLMYDPDDPNTGYSPFQPQWDSGERLSNWTRTTSASNLDARKLVSWDQNAPQRWRATADYLQDSTSPAFPGSLCGIESAGVYQYDLNRKNGCDDDDRATLRNWLYGWEYRDSTTGTSGTRRAWPMGGVNLSTAAVVGPPGIPPWMLKSSNNELDRFVSRFQSDSRIAQRPTVAYVGTTQGYLHALATGRYRSNDDTCTSIVEHQGYFARSGGCTSSRDYGTGDEVFAYLPYKLLPFYVENFRRRGDASIARATVDASPAVADVDLGQTGEYSDTTGYVATAANQWRLDTTTPTAGAKTVLASATGPKQSVLFALDISNPSDAKFPMPLWEFDMRRDRFLTTTGQPCLPTNTSNNCKSLPDLFVAAGAVKPDSTGSRHAPTIVRMDFGPGGTKWVAIFASDYLPDATNPTTANSVGTVYLIDLKTGLPVQVPGGTTRSRLAGIVTLGSAADANEGIGGEVAAVDANDDGVFDVLYVPSTSGKIYRINTSDVDATGRPLGKVLASCVIANAKTVTDVPSAWRPYQRIFSSISVKMERGGSGNVAHIYFGTANSPDLANEPEDLMPLASKPHYYLMAFNDPRPLSATCGGTYAWSQELAAGQLVWGGVASSSDSVFTTTASGKAANICSLNAEGGKLYAYSAAGVAAPGNGASLGGQGVNAPVLYDNHLIILTADSKVRVMGEQGKFNNPGGAGLQRRSNILIWDVRSGSKIQEVVP
ncbi:pilus assembly protein PilY [Corallococcus sp. H22C18031201]|nr:pilus assembly protein PilY [Corallococcus sp. H22C18031201]